METTAPFYAGGQGSVERWAITPSLIRAIGRNIVECRFCGVGSDPFHQPVDKRESHYLQPIKGLPGVALSTAQADFGRDAQSQQQSLKLYQERAIYRRDRPAASSLIRPIRIN